MLWPVIISGFGAGMVFVPLATTSMADLPNEQIGNAAGLFNLMRNVGGSVGISIVNTVVARHEQVHRVMLSGHINGASRAFRHALTGATALTERTGASPLKAYAILNGTLSQQARLLAYVDDFQYLAAVCFACVPLVFLLRKATARKGVATAAH
jgi:DHA2 family multidrug resistance protein